MQQNLKIKLHYSYGTYRYKKIEYLTTSYQGKEPKSENISESG